MMSRGAIDTAVFKRHANVLVASVCVASMCAMASFADDTVLLPVGENTESVSAETAPITGEGFTITTDGKGPRLGSPLAETPIVEIIDEVSAAAGDETAPDTVVTGSVRTAPVINNLPRTLPDRQRAADVDLASVDIQVKFDGLDAEPVLNVSTLRARRAYKAGEVVPFQASFNYPAWIEKAEVRIYKSGTMGDRSPVATVPVDGFGYGSWTMPADGDGEFEYVLRVYDTRGRFDETQPLTMVRTDRGFEPHERNGTAPEDAIGMGEDRTAFRNIPVHGGAVTVYGREVPDGYAVTVLGEDVPVDDQGAFVIQRILPSGDHDIDVAVDGASEKGVQLSREINIPSNDWFYVGIADVTVGKRFGDGDIVAAAEGEYDDVYSKGRLAFYLKGKIRGKYILTAAADTDEADLDEIFSGLDKKDPRSLLRRIDPDDYYPVYGDDSTSVEDAPTSGKFYVRLERGDSHVMWGNAKTSIKGSHFIRSERTVYGASGVYRSEDTTSFGERRFEVSGYAAQPDTLPQRDVLRGTGGSAYFLKRQDISIGSETVTVEVRDPQTGRIIERTTLVYGRDYTIDYVQGIILLDQPLSSSAFGGGLIRDTTLGDNTVNLVAQYEYTPAVGDVDGYSYGGRAQAWLGENIRFGATGVQEKVEYDGANLDQRMYGVDVRWRHSDTSWLDLEFAQSEGPGFGRSISTDGGLTITDTPTAGVVNRDAKAFRLNGQLDLADVTQGQIAGRIGAYFESREAGFSTLDYDVGSDEILWGFAAELDLSDRFVLNLTYDDYSNDTDLQRREAEANIVYMIDEYWSVAFGVKYSDFQGVTATNSTSSIDTGNGSRTDVAGKIIYQPDDDQEYYVFAQGTVQRDGDRDENNRAGVGLRRQLTEKIGVEGEVSYGTHGWGALAAVTYDPTADEHYYVGYRLDGDRSYREEGLDGDDLGGIVIGAKRRYNDMLSAFGENNYDIFGKKRSLTSTYGVTYTPDANWTFSGGAEIGSLRDQLGDDLDRQAFSIGTSYVDDDKLSARIRGEVRFDDYNDPARDASSYLFSVALQLNIDPDWRLLGHVDVVLSETEQASIRNGDYIEGSIGLAYRPVENDRLNALFKYTYLEDLPAPDQVTADGSFLGPRQMSHVLSADFTYDVNRWLSVGAKYGFRIGEVETARGSGIYRDSNAHLGIVRADIHVVHDWDVLLEGRVLASPSTDTIEWGAVAAVYKHFGNNLKAGVGYNFGKFSDDLTDQTFDDQGIFVNVIAKF